MSVTRSTVSGASVSGVFMVLLVLLLAVGSSFAGVPTKINYQGRVTDSDTGEPLPGNHSMTFRIFDAESGGMELWSQNRVVMADTAGVVSVILGDIDPIDISFDGPRWLEIEVRGEVLSPRRELVSVPYAFVADEAGHAEHADSAAFATYAESAVHAGNADSLGGIPAGTYFPDRHSLDADDGDPEDAVYVDESGNVAIGTSNPLADLYIQRDKDSSAEIEIYNPNSGSLSKEGLSLASEDGPAGIMAHDNADPNTPSALTIYNYRSAANIRLQTHGFDRVVVSSNGYLGVGTDEPDHLLHVDGIAKADRLYLGDSLLDGQLRVYGEGGSNYIAWLTDYANRGGRLILADEDGVAHSSFEPDASSGGGGYLRVEGGVGGGSGSVTIEGNYSDTKKPRVNIYGVSQSVTFDMTKTENQSVMLPAKAISAYEIMDEPGLAANISYEVPGGLPLSTGFNTIGQQSITVPASGYVIVMGSCQPTGTHYTTTDIQCEFGVSDGDGSFPDNQDCMWMLPKEIGGVSPTYRIFTTVVSNHRVFRVASQGTYTYYYLARLHNGTVTANDVQLTVIYFPSSYGGVETLVSEGGPHPFSVEDESVPPSRVESFATEREESEAAYRERVEEELAIMREQIAALRREMEADPNGRLEPEE